MGFSLLDGMVNPHPAKLLGEGLESVEFLIGQIQKCHQAGFATYIHHEFYWSAELWDGESIFYSEKYINEKRGEGMRGENR